MGFGRWAVVAAALTGACGGGDEKGPPAGAGGGKKPPAPVIVAKVETRDVTATLEVVGHVKASAVVAVSSRVAGALAAVRFKEGDEVKEGQALFSIDPKPLQLALEQAKARLEHDRILARSAEQDAARYAGMAAANLASRQDIDRVRATAAAAKAALQEDKAAIDAAELQLSYAEITAPIGGRTGTLLVNAGNFVRAGDGNGLVEIRQIQPIFVSFVVPERELPRLRKLFESGAAIAVSATPEGDGAKTSTGTLGFIDHAVDAATGTIRLQATFTNEDRNLWPGQFVRVRLELAHDQGVVTVPARALQDGQAGPFVYVVGPDQKVKPHNVKVGRIEDDTATIVDGVTSGQTIVIDGQMRLFPGAEVVSVKPNGEPAGGAPPAPGAATPGAPAPGAAPAGAATPDKGGSPK